MKKNTQYIFVKSFTRNGVTYHAADYGKKAFRIPVDKLNKRK